MITGAMNVTREEID